MEKAIHEIQEEYDLELDNIIKKINKELSLKKKLRKENNKLIVLLQFPDGLKPYSTTIVDYLKEKIKEKVEFLIWIETCYGACDIPVLSQKLEKQIDLVVQFGHNSLMPERQ